MDEIISGLKEAIRQDMIEEFKIYGNIRNQLLMYAVGKLITINLPDEHLDSHERRTAMEYKLSRLCEDPIVQASFLLYNGLASTPINHAELTQSLSGTSSMNKRAVIVMQFHTPDKTELIIYEVDKESKTIIGQIANGERFQPRYL